MTERVNASQPPTCRSGAKSLRPALPWLGKPLGVGAERPSTLSGSLGPATQAWLALCTGPGPVEAATAGSQSILRAEAWPH